MQKTDLRNNAMMRRLLEALDQHQDIGHYGRLVFAMVARHFMEADEVVAELVKDPDFTELQAKALLQQVEQNDYNPPRADRIRQWQKEQAFQIIPDGDPDAGNLYRDLKFPDHVYRNIEEYHEAKAEAQV